MIYIKVDGNIYRNVVIGVNVEQLTLNRGTGFMIAVQDRLHLRITARRHCFNAFKSVHIASDHSTLLTGGDHLILRGDIGIQNSIGLRPRTVRSISRKSMRLRGM